jgi:hypothetical protein
VPAYSSLHVDIAEAFLQCFRILEPSTSSTFQTVLPHPSRLTRARPGLKQRKREWLNGHGTKLDWIKYRAEDGGRSNPATHAPIGDPSLDAGFSGLSIKTPSNRPSTVKSHLWKRRCFLIATCCPLGSAACFLFAFLGNSVFTPDVPQRHTLNIPKSQSSHLFALPALADRNATATPPHSFLTGTLQQLVCTNCPPE